MILAVELGRDWNENRKAKRQIMHLFRATCTDANKDIRTDCSEFTVAELTFSWSAPTPNSDGDVYHEVHVTKARLAGDAPNRIRVFRYFTGVNQANAIVRFFADKPPKGSISWPPYITYRK